MGYVVVFLKTGPLDIALYNYILVLLLRNNTFFEEYMCHELYCHGTFYRGHNTSSHSPFFVSSVPAGGFLPRISFNSSFVFFCSSIASLTSSFIPKTENGRAIHMIMSIKSNKRNNSPKAPIIAGIMLPVLTIKKSKKFFS